MSSFGFSGTNAHIILEEAPAVPIPRRVPQGHLTTSPTTYAPSERFSSAQAQLLTLSARSPEALNALVRAYRDFLVIKGPNATTPLSEICYTASVRRTHHDYRLALVFQTWMELIDQLEVYLRGEARAGLASGRKHPNRRPKLVFVFSGQGPQWWAMGRELLVQEPVFRATVERIDQLLRHEAEATGATWSLLSELMADEAHSRLDQTEIAQPALFALQVALADLWRSWGIEPEAVVGHSMGEVAAAYVAGGLSLPEAVRVIFHRGRLMQPATGQGKMAAIELSATETERILGAYGDRLSIAAINGPTSTVISGEVAALEEVVQSLQQEKIFVRVLPVNYAFHSPQMEPFLAELEEVLEGLEFSHPVLPICSTVTGQALNSLNLDAAYWSRNVREPIRFADAVGVLLAEGYNTFLELSPHPVLVGAISQCLHQHGQKGTALPSLRRGEKEQATLLGTLGTLYSIGYPIDWHRLYPDGGQCVSLPSYPWQRERYWLQSTDTGHRTPYPGGHLREGIFDWRHASRGYEAGSLSDHPLLGRRLPALAHLPGSHFWEIKLEGQSLAYLNDHRVRGLMVLPATVYLEMALAGAAEALGETPHPPTEAFCLEDVAFREALLLPEDGSQTLQLILSPVEDASRGSAEVPPSGGLGGPADREASKQMTFQIFSLPAYAERGPASWTLHARGKICLSRAEADAEVEDASRRSAEVPPSGGLGGLADRAVEPVSRVPLVPSGVRSGGVSENIADIRARCPLEVSAAAYYQGLHERGLEYGPRFQGIEQIWRRDGEALGQIRLPQALASSGSPEAETQAYQLHPALLDACLQVLGISLPADNAQAIGQNIYIPASLERMHIYRPLPTQLWSHVRLSVEDASRRSAEVPPSGGLGGPDNSEADIPVPSGVLVGDVRLLDESGQVVAEILGLGLQRLGRAVQETIQKIQNDSAPRTPEGISERASSTVKKGSPPTPSPNQETEAGAEEAYQDEKSDLIGQVLLAKDPAERQQLLETYLRQRVAKVMKIPVSKLDIHKPLEDLGFDSLMAVELKYRVESELEVEVPVRNLIEKPTVTQLASQLHDLLIE